MVRHRCALSGYRLGALLYGKSAVHALVSISSCGLVSVFLRPGKGLIAEGKRGDLESRSVDFRVPFLLGRSCGWPAMHHEPCRLGSGASVLRCPGQGCLGSRRCCARLPTGSSDTEQLPLSGLADSCLPVCRTVAGKGWKGLAERAAAEEREQGDALG